MPPRKVPPPSASKDKNVKKGGVSKNRPTEVPFTPMFEIENLVVDANAVPPAIEDAVDDVLHSINLTRYHDDINKFKKALADCEAQSRNMRNLILEKETIVDNLEAQIQNMEREARSPSAYQELMKSCSDYQTLYIQQNLKCSSMEVSYNSKLNELRNQYQTWSKQQCSKQQSLDGEVKRIRELLLKTQKEAKDKEEDLKKFIADMTANLEMKDREILIIRKKNEELIKKCEQQLTEVDVQNELAKKDQIIRKYEKQFHDLQTAKNKIITEQAYKLQHVHRAIDQPTSLSTPVVRIDEGLQNGAEVLIIRSRKSSIQYHLTASSSSTNTLPRKQLLVKVIPKKDAKKSNVQQLAVCTTQVNKRTESVPVTNAATNSDDDLPPYPMWRPPSTPPTAIKIPESSK